MRSKMIVLGLFLLFFSMTGLAYSEMNDSLTLEPLNEESIMALSAFESEAGISAYTQVTNVDLDKAEDAYKNVEIKTNEYIIGSVELDDYPEEDNVHVYVDTAGWIVAYYLEEEHASKIIDWKGYEVSGEVANTKVEQALRKVATAMGISVSDIKLYDFRYPNATNMMIVIDEEDIDNAIETFRIKVPSNYLMYSRTWSHAIHNISGGDGINSYIKIDNTIITNNTIRSSGWGIWEGNITAVQLSPDIFHDISLYHDEYRNSSGFSYVAIVLIYKP